ncbi:MAG: thioesterase domain-containing protein [Acidobacteriota bacterium]
MKIRSTIRRTDVDAGGRQTPTASVERRSSADDTTIFPFGGASQGAYAEFLEARFASPTTRPDEATREDGERRWLTGALVDPGFPLILAELAAWHSLAVYDVLGRSGPLAHQRLNGEHFRIFASDNSHGYGVSVEDHALIVFSGSNEGVDWLENAAVRRIGEPGRHAGFAASLERLREPLLDWIAGLPDVDGIVCTGHSLGGALAVLAADALHRHGHTVRAVVTFGAPMVGGEAFHEAYALHDVTWKTAVVGDPITTLPPARLGYRPVGRPYGFPTPIRAGSLDETERRGLAESVGLIAASLVPGWVGGSAYILAKLFGAKAMGLATDAPNHRMSTYVDRCRAEVDRHVDHSTADERLLLQHRRYLDSTLPSYSHSGDRFLRQVTGRDG